MKRIQHPAERDWYTCMRVALYVLRRRGTPNDAAGLMTITDALIEGRQFDEQGQEVANA